MSASTGLIQLQARPPFEASPSVKLRLRDPSDSAPSMDPGYAAPGPGPAYHGQGVGPW